MNPEDRKRLNRMLAPAKKLRDAIDRKALTRESLLSSEDEQWFVTTPLYAIGEEANNVSDECAEKHREIPLVQIAGLRHRLVHDYEHTNWSLISEVVFNELGPLIDALEKALEE